MAEEKTVGTTELRADRDTVIWKDRKHWLWFPFSFTKYSVRNDRLYRDKGLLKTFSDETFLYRIVDIKLVRTLGQKICGTGTITLCTRVDSDPDIDLVNVKRPKETKELLSDLIEESRARHNVVGKEFYSFGGSGHESELDTDMEIPGGF